MKKRILTLGLTLLTALGVVAPNVSALNGGSMTCDSLKATLRADSSDTGSAVIILNENCVANLTVSADQNITLDTAGYTLSSTTGATITVAEGGNLTITNLSDKIGSISGVTAIDNSGDVTIKSGSITGKIISSSDAETVVTGGSFSVDPSDYVDPDYVVTIENGRYVVSSDDATIDTSKITSSDENLKDALIATLTYYLENPDTSTENGRKLKQLADAINLGHTLSVSLVIDDNPEITDENLLATLLDATMNENLASVIDASFVVTDLTNSSLSVSLSELAKPVSVTFQIPNQYKSALSTRGVNVLHVYADPDDTSAYDAEFVDTVNFDGSGNVVFETDSFSLFALTYDGDPITGSTDADDGGEFVPQTGAATITTATAVTTPDTAGFFGLELTVFHLLMLIGITLVVSVFIAYAIKRAYIRNKISLK